MAERRENVSFPVRVYMPRVRLVFQHCRRENRSENRFAHCTICYPTPVSKALFSPAKVGWSTSKTRCVHLSMVLSVVRVLLTRWFPSALCNSWCTTLRMQYCQYVDQERRGSSAPVGVASRRECVFEMPYFERCDKPQVCMRELSSSVLEQPINSVFQPLLPCFHGVIISPGSSYKALPTCIRALVFVARRAKRLFSLVETRQAVLARVISQARG